MKISLKKASVKDIPVLLDIEKSVAGTRLYSATLKESEWIEELKKGIVHLIETDSIVGSIAYRMKTDNHAYISGLAIKPSYQGQGIGKAALAMVLEKLSDVKRIDLVTHPDNVPAIKLYQSFGFVIEDRKENYFGDGEPRNVLALIR